MRSTHRTNTNMEKENKVLLETELKIAKAVATALDSKKAVDITVLEVGKQTTLADFFVIATGTSSTHVNALADETEYALKTKLGIEPYHVEGKESWILMDYGTVVVHIFTQEARKFYDLERLWADNNAVKTDLI